MNYLRQKKLEVKTLWRVSTNENILYTTYTVHKYKNMIYMPLYSSVIIEGTWVIKIITGVETGKKSIIQQA